MSIEGIQITTGEVRGCAERIRNINKSLSTTLDNIKKDMDSLSAFWQSDSSETIRQRFKSFSENTFPEYQAIVERYASFLVETADGYEKVEKSINDAASAFK